MWCAIACMTEPIISETSTLDLSTNNHIGLRNHVHAGADISDHRRVVMVIEVRDGLDNIVV